MPGTRASEAVVSAHGPRTAAGKLHLLDLTDIKARMGARWEKTSDLVERFFDGAIRRNLGPGDTFVRLGEMSYILLLRDLSPEEAKIKCCTICEELSERLFGDQVHSASLRALVTSLASSTLPEDAPVEAFDEILERDGSETIIRVGPPPGANGASAPHHEGLDDGSNECAPLRFKHRPIWDTATNVVISYLCQSEGPVHAPDDMRGTGLAGPEASQAAVDRAVLRECATSMQSTHKRGFRLISGASVALDTLSYSRFWLQYSEELQKIPPGMSRDLIFFVTGIDRGIPNIRLAQVLPKLSKHSRGVFCVLSDRGYIGTRFSRTATHAIGIDLAPGSAESLSLNRITELSQQAASAGLAAFVFGISSTSVMLHAISHGIRYLEGPVIRQAVGEPRYAFAQSLGDVYASP
jgi:GGDEF domain-containing protein